MQTKEDAIALAKSMVTTGNRLGMEVTAQITEMDNPIGRMFGNCLLYTSPSPRDG